MRPFLHCVVYLAVVGFVMFLVGRKLPAERFHESRFPYAPYAFEKDGEVYEKLGVRVWKTKLPDMSRFFPSLMPPRTVVPGDADHLEALIKETCIAEFTHVLLFFAGFACLFIWDGNGGVIVTAVYSLFGNLPFIIIQRYNRPRLVRTKDRILVRKRQSLTGEEGERCHANAHTDL